MNSPLGIFCLRVSQENYPEVNLVPDVLDISILCRRTEEVPRTSIKSEFSRRKKKTFFVVGKIQYPINQNFTLDSKHTN